MAREAALRTRASSEGAAQERGEGVAGGGTVTTYGKTFNVVCDPKKLKATISIDIGRMLPAKDGSELLLEGGDSRNAVLVRALLAIACSLDFEEARRYAFSLVRTNELFKMPAA
jgi:hypothetical protein